MNKVTTDGNTIKKILRRRLAGNEVSGQWKITGAFPSMEEAVKIMSSGEKLVFYWGVDPTGKDIHLGHAVQLYLLKNLIELGHKIIILIGDFTAKIGDPTDKSAARRALSDEEIAANMKTYLSQIHKILPEGSFEVRYNSQWLAKMTLEDVVSLASHVTVQQMLAREMFDRRIKEDKPIHVHEFLYPLMQGYDSVAMKVDGEVGGNDQIFNMLVGRDLEKEIIGKEKIVLGTRLLVDVSSGKKMSKSEGTLISINDSPQEIRRKILELDDEMIQTVFELCTDIEQDWIDENREGMKEKPREYKEKLSDALVKIFHGDGFVATSREAVNVEKMELTKLLIFAGAASTTTAAKALISQGAVEIDGKKIDRWDVEIKSGQEIKAGKGKLIKVK